MKNLFACVALSLNMTAAMVSAAPPKAIGALSTATDCVNALFESLKGVSNRGASDSYVSKARLAFDGYFISTEMHCPNEFKNLWNQNSNAVSYDTDIKPSRYIGLFIEMFRTQEYDNCSFSFEPINSCIVDEPEFKKNEQPSRFSQVIVRKVYSRNGKPFAVF